MNKYVDQVKNDKSHINTLRFVVGIMTLFLIGSGVVTMLAVAEPDKQHGHKRSRHGGKVGVYRYFGDQAGVGG